MDFNLNRYKRNINQNTPNQVIIDLVVCCGKKISEENIEKQLEKIVSFLENYNYNLPPDINYYSKNDYIKLADFVSATSSEWQKENLHRAQQHIIDFDEKLEISLPIRYGYKNNNNIFNYDLIMLYNYCCHRNIKLEKEDTIDSIAEKIKNRKEEDSLDADDCVEIIKDNVDDCNKVELLQMMKFLKSRNKKEKEIIISPVPEKIVEEKKRPMSSVEEIKNNININYMISRSDLDENEALVYAAKFLALNLIDSDSRVKELMEYNRCRMEEITYSPLSNDKFGERYNINNYYYRLDYFWHPEIADIYPQKNMNILLKNEAMKSDYGKTELDASLCYKNFYLGIIPGQENQLSFINNTPALQMDKKRILTYGIREKEQFILLSIEEIITHFKNYKSLVDFTNNEKINESAIRKLKSICKLFSNDDDYMNLLDLIDNIENNKFEDNTLIEDFKNKYLFASDQIDRVLEEIFFLAMYIRGWKINDMYDYPLKKENCLNYKENERKIINNIRTSIRTINHYTDNIADKNISKMIKQLPLMKYDNTDKKFYNMEGGVTIFERMKIINDTDENNYEYLKESSNIFTTSAYYYLNILASKKLFNLDNLEFV